jgi:hypothetical protein
VPVPRHASERSCIDFAFFYNFYWSLELFLQCVIFLFSFYSLVFCSISVSKARANILFYFPTMYVYSLYCIYIYIYIRYQNFPYEPSLDVSIRPNLFVYGYYQFIRRYKYGSLLNFTSFYKVQHRDNKIDKLLL